MRKTPSLLLPIVATLLTLSAAAQNPPAPATNPTPWLQTVRTLAINQLDAELRYARDQHAAASRPLPESVRQLMQGLIDEELLVAARYTVSIDAPTLPALLNRGHRELLDQDHAVSVPDLIIFSREPALANAADARWWGHELGHLLQYRRWGGTRPFAQRYVDDFQAVERDAEMLGQQVQQRYLQRQSAGSATPATIRPPATGPAAP